MGIWVTKTTAVEIALSGYPYGGHLLPGASFLNRLYALLVATAREIREEV